jgi:hypothetical protein
MEGVTQSKKNLQNIINLFSSWSILPVCPFCPIRTRFTKNVQPFLFLPEIMQQGSKLDPDKITVLLKEGSVFGCTGHILDPRHTNMKVKLTRKD